MFEKLKDILVEEMSINPSDITLDAELVGDLTSIHLSLPTWSCFARKDSMSNLTILRFRIS